MIFLHRKKTGFSCSRLIAIGQNSRLYCTLVRGKVATEVYDSFFNHLTKEFKNNRFIVFWMDNARIHEQSKEKIKDSKHKVIYNSLY